MVQEIDNYSEYQSQVSSGQGTFIFFTATWNGPARMVQPHFERCVDEFPNARFFILDIDKIPNLADELEISTLPNIVFFRNGQTLGNLIGGNPYALREFVERYSE